MVRLVTQRGETLALSAISKLMLTCQEEAGKAVVELWAVRPSGDLQLLARWEWRLPGWPDMERPAGAFAQVAKLWARWRPAEAWRVAQSGELEPAAVASAYSSTAVGGGQA